MLFGIQEKLEKNLSNNSQINTFHGQTCQSSNSVWDFVKVVNDDVLSQIQIIVKENPGCTQLVKCELAYYAPEKIKK